MTIAGLLDRTNAAANRRLDQHVKNVTAVFDEDLWPMLEEMGLLADLDAGRLSCHFSGIPLTRQNVGGLVRTSAGVKLIAESAVLSAPLPAAVR